MSDQFAQIEPLGLVNLSYDFSSLDILSLLLPLENDAERVFYVGEINRQGKMHDNDAFNLRFDQSVQSKDIRRRLFVRFSGMPRRAA